MAGSLYVARRGESADGHAFAAGKLWGAERSPVVEYEADEAVAQIVVEDDEARVPCRGTSRRAIHWGAGRRDDGVRGQDDHEGLALPDRGATGRRWPLLSFNNDCHLSSSSNRTHARHWSGRWGAGSHYITYLTDIVSRMGHRVVCGHAHVGIAV